MRRLKKAGLTLLLSSFLASNTLLSVFANQTNQLLTDVVPVESTASSNETASYDTALGPGVVNSPGYIPPEATYSPDNPPPEVTNIYTLEDGGAIVDGHLETAPAETTETTTTETTSTETAPPAAQESAPAESVSTAGPSLPETTVESTTAPQMDADGPLSVPKRVPRLQTTILLNDTYQWSDPFVNDQPVNVDNRGFSKISTFIEGIHGDILYRVYTSAYGWTSWVMNGQQTALPTEWQPIEAIQFRFSGPVADQYDIYYTSSLSNQKSTSWAKNGQTCGSMNQGLYMTGFQLKFVEKGTDPQLDTSYPLYANHTDGVQYVDGVLRYITGNGANYTGWGNVGDDWYYFNDSYPVTGWQYLDGYKYYFGEDGKLWSDLESLVGTAGPFKIRINKEMNCLTVYAQDGANGFIIPVKSFLTSCGDDTPLGTFYIPEKYRWRLMINDVWTQYATRLGKGLPFLMHSIIYDQPNPYTVWASTYNNLGIARSAGCIRLTTADSKWIYDYCAVGTAVEVYNSPNPGPYNRPTIEYEIPFEQRWDPTDDSVTPEGIEAAKQQIYAAFGYQPQ